MYIFSPQKPELNSYLKHLLASYLWVSEFVTILIFIIVVIRISVLTFIRKRLYNIIIKICWYIFFKQVLVTYMYFKLYCLFYSHCGFCVSTQKAPTAIDFTMTIYRIYVCARVCLIMLTATSCSGSFMMHFFLFFQT